MAAGIFGLIVLAIFASLGDGGGGSHTNYR
jgi:hypothetical protein